MNPRVFGYRSILRKLSLLQWHKHFKKLVIEQRSPNTVTQVACSPWPVFVWPANAFCMPYSILHKVIKTSY